MSYLNSFFDKIYCINLDKRPDRWKAASEQFNKYGIQVERVSAVDGEKSKYFLNSGLNRGNLKCGQVGIIESNINILEEAQQKQYNSILIFEDDVVLSEEIKNIESYFHELPSNWDMVWFSGNHNTHVSGVNPPYDVSEKILKLHSTFAAHAIGIKKSMYTAILSGIQRMEHPLDVYYSLFQKINNCYCFKSVPPIATQASGFSNIENTEVEYGWLIK